MNNTFTMSRVLCPQHVLQPESTAVSAGEQAVDETTAGLPVGPPQHAAHVRQLHPTDHQHGATDGGLQEGRRRRHGTRDAGASPGHVTDVSDGDAAGNATAHRRGHDVELSTLESTPTAAAEHVDLAAERESRQIRAESHRTQHEGE